MTSLMLSSGSLPAASLAAPSTKLLTPDRFHPLPGVQRSQLPIPSTPHLPAGVYQQQGAIRQAPTAAWDSLSPFTSEIRSNRSSVSASAFCATHPDGRTLVLFFCALREPNTRGRKAIKSSDSGPGFTGYRF